MEKKCDIVLQRRKTEIEDVENWIFLFLVLMGPNNLLEDFFS